MEHDVEWGVVSMKIEVSNFSSSSIKGYLHTRFPHDDYRSLTLYIYITASRGTYQDICPEMTGRLWCVMTFNAEGRERHNSPVISCYRGINILVMSPEETCNICKITLKKIKISFQTY